MKSLRVENPAQHTAMFREAAETPVCVASQLAANAEIITDLAAVLRARRPRAFVTIARGSSDHAATYARALVETRLGVLTSAIPPSTFSVYEAPLSLENSLCLMISQSGRSPDLLAAARAARGSGAIVVALVNDPQSPLAEIASVVLPQCAAPEVSAAATKSFVASLTGIAHLVAAWADDKAMQVALKHLPAALQAAWALDWPEARTMLQAADHLYTIGRGLNLSIAQEAAHKLKEVAMLHAEAFSAAEVLHGPNELVGEGFPVLLFRSDDAAGASVDLAAERLAQQGAQIAMLRSQSNLTGKPDDIAGTSSGSKDLYLPVSPHSALSPIIQIQTFYRMANALAAERGHNPDTPRHVAKVTHTV